MARIANAQEERRDFAQPEPPADTCEREVSMLNCSFNHP